MLKAAMKMSNRFQTVHSGANIVTQASGAQAGLMGISFEAMIIDNDMLGAILRSTAKWMFQKIQCHLAQSELWPQARLPG